MNIVAIDPGTEESGHVIWNVEDGKHSISHMGNVDNETVLGLIGAMTRFDKDTDVVAIEWIQSYGMAVGKSTFETCLWVGRFVQTCITFGYDVRLIPRLPIKLHHCGSPRAKDGNISQALRDKYGEKGTKKEPGFFYGVSKHAWQACAVAAFVAEGGESELELKF
jgi:hypothetical protein